MEWLIYLLIIILFFILRGAFYFCKLQRIKKLKRLYYEYIGGKEKFEFIQNKPQIISLFREAGVKNFSVTHIEQISYGSGLRYSLDGFDNMASNRSDIVPVIKGKFEETIGVFKFNMIQSFNPLYWIEFIIKFPTKLLSYLELSPSTSIKNTIQLIFWAAGLLTFLDKFGLINVINWFQ